MGLSAHHEAAPQVAKSLPLSGHRHSIAAALRRAMKEGRNNKDYLQ
jgi:hypothetical protein